MLMAAAIPINCRKIMVIMTMPMTVAIVRRKVMVMWMLLMMKIRRKL